MIGEGKLIAELFKEVIREGGFLQRTFGKGVLQGQVLDEDENALAGVIILLNSDESLSEETSLNGKFIFEKLKGKYKISLKYKEKSIENVDVVLISPGQALDIKIKIQRDDDTPVQEESPTLKEEKSGKSIREKVWEAVSSITSGDSAKIFSPKEVVDEVHKREPDVKSNSIRCHLISDCVNHTSRHHYQGGKDRYWHVSKGQFRLFRPESDSLSGAEQQLKEEISEKDDVSVADQIRTYVFEHHITPARKHGEREITLRSGDIHKELNFSNRYPAVCGALRSNIFCEKYGLELLKEEGPKQGSNTFFTFKI